ncbi:hypothetical protein CROQUDRAFT_8975, partial [Cronartium quercuum f. sp. fusiforme G11]
SWGLTEDVWETLWETFECLRNTSKTQQISMDILYETMNLTFNLIEAERIISDKAQHSQTFSQKIVLWDSIMRHRLDSHYGTVGLVELLEEDGFGTLSKSERDKKISNIQ